MFIVLKLPEIWLKTIIVKFDQRNLLIFSSIHYLIVKQTELKNLLQSLDVQFKEAEEARLKNTRLIMK